MLRGNGNVSLMHGMGEWAPVEKLSVPVSAIGPSIARAALRPTLGDLPDPDEEIVELLTSALVTNAVKHSGMTEPDVVEVGLYRNDARAVRVQVTDTGPGFDPSHMPPGFGMQILNHLASRWGVEHESSGTTVWFEVGR
jgi:anti-sigma regulatory factor (Ser/Thr protein kinase)